MMNTELSTRFMDMDTDTLKQYDKNHQSCDLTHFKYVDMITQQVSLQTNIGTFSDLYC